jgi:hypothetical protein
MFDGIGESNFSQGGSLDFTPTVYQVPQLSITISNTLFVPTNNIQILSATITYGLDVGVSSATIEFTADPNINKYSVIQIFCDAVPRNTPTLRFTGLYLRTEANLWPHSFSVICKGMLYLAQQYQQPFYIGKSPVEIAAVAKGLPVGQLMISVYDQSGNLLSPGLVDAISATDQDIVRAVLHQVPGLAFNDGDIGGTGRFFGIFAGKDLVWPPYRTALEQCQLMDSVSLGFRLYESLGGVIRRDQIYGYPTGDADAQFIEGINIWEGKGSRSVEQLCNASYVEGATVGSFDSNGDPTRLIYAFLQQSNPFQPSAGFEQAGWNPIADQFKSPLIETNNSMIAVGVNTTGLSADDVARWRLSERNRELVNTTFVTFQDYLLFPGRTITVNTPHMAVTEPQWLQRVEVRVQAEPVLFQQTVYTIGGGLAGFGPSLPYTPPIPY